MWHQIKTGHCHHSMSSYWPIGSTRQLPTDTDIWLINQSTPSMHYCSNLWCHLKKMAFSMKTCILYIIYMQNNSTLMSFNHFLTIFRLKLNPQTLMLQIINMLQMINFNQHKWKGNVTQNFWEASYIEQTWEDYGHNTMLLQTSELSQ